MLHVLPEQADIAEEESGVDLLAIRLEDDARLPRSQRLLWLINAGAAGYTFSINYRMPPIYLIPYFFFAQKDGSNPASSLFFLVMT